MKYSKTSSPWRPIILFLTLIAIVTAVVLFVFQRSAVTPGTVSFEPPYPEVNNGDPIMAVFEGRIPCGIEGCEKMKLGLVLYHDTKTNKPTTYWLGRVLVSTGDERVVTQGTWTIRKGVEGYPQAVVYELDSNADEELRYYWRVNDDILLPLDENMSPKAGNSGWGYMLSRYSESYGPRTYE